MSRRPRLLDLYCGAGGASVGYQRAGFDVVGVDSSPMPRYPFEFHQADAIHTLDCLIEGDGPIWLHEQPFDVIHASPPCQAYTGVPNRRDDHPDLLDETRDRLRASGLSYVIENVPGAPMPDAFVLCGATFLLPIVRHRLFETNPRIELVPSACPQSAWGRGTDHGSGYWPYAHGAWRPAWREYVLPLVWPWMTLEDAEQAIPPAYTQFIGEQLLDQITRQDDVA